MNESLLVTGESILYSAEGATTPETLRQKDRKFYNSGKRLVLTEGVNLSGANTEGINLVLYEIHK